MATEPTNWEKRIQLAVDRWYWTPKGTAGTEQLPKFIVTLLREFAEEAAAMLRQMSDSHGAIDLQRTAEQRREDYAAQRVLITAASKILSLLPPKKEGQ